MLIPITRRDPVSVFRTIAACPQTVSGTEFHLAPSCPGTMVYDGMRRELDRLAMTKTYTYRHRCSECGHGEWYEQQYPIIEYAIPTAALDLDHGPGDDTLLGDDTQS